MLLYDVVLENLVAVLDAFQLLLEFLGLPLSVFELTLEFGHGLL